MKGYYDKPYKKAPTVLRISMCDPWDSNDVDIPTSFKPQSGGSPRGNGVRFYDVHQHQNRGSVPCCIS